MPLVVMELLQRGKKTNKFSHLFPKVGLLSVSFLFSVLQSEKERRVSSRPHIFTAKSTANSERRENAVDSVCFTKSSPPVDDFVNALFFVLYLKLT